jgi:hypothetical protein
VVERDHKSEALLHQGQTWLHKGEKIRGRSQDRQRLGELPSRTELSQARHQGDQGQGMGQTSVGVRSGPVEEAAQNHAEETSARGSPGHGESGS